MKSSVSIAPNSVFQQAKLFISNIDQIKIGLRAGAVVYMIYDFEVYERSSFITENYAKLSLVFLILGIVFAGIVLLSHNLIYRRETWMVFSVCTFLGIWFSWPFTSNHGFLIFYFSLTVLVSLCQKEDLRLPVLTRNTRLIIGFAMLFAVIQKFTTPEFMSGSFFYHMSFSDPRFSSLAEILGVKDQIASSYAQMNAYVNSVIETQGTGQTRVLTTLADNSYLKAMSQIQVYLLLLVEVLVALLFLLSTKYRVSKLRDYVLLMFVIGTYIVSIEYLFGFAFLAIAFIQSESGKSKTVKLAYLVTFIVTLVGMAFRVWHYKAL